VQAQQVFVSVFVILILYTVIAVPAQCTLHNGHVRQCCLVIEKKILA